MNWLSDEGLKDPVALGRYAALTGLSPEAFHSRFSLSIQT